MRAPHARLLCVSIACALAVAGPSRAAQFDCGQPVSPGDSPLTSDALAILRAATGQPIAFCSGRYFCVCDVNGNGAITAADALLDLRHAIGHFGPRLDCIPDCPAEPTNGCTSATFTLAESEFDMGWTGIAHDQTWPRGSGFSAHVRRECTGDGSECERQADCAGSGTCEPTCDCIGDTTCELVGPTHEKHCVNDLRACVTNADCDPSIPCVHLPGPPLPLSTGGTPICIVHVFDSPLTGTFDPDSGHFDLSTTLRARVRLGIAVDKPCPRCGPSDQNPEIGDKFLCEGGQRHGLACTVDGVSEVFGGTSFDCAPDLASGVSGVPLAIPLRLTTGSTTQTAQLPCKGFGFAGNPTVPGSSPKCTDKISFEDPVCTSNADCRRCTEDATLPCTSDTDCAGKGACAEAPDQPVSCGFWCHCGFCDQNPSLPCFQTSDCPVGQTCQAGTGAANTATMGQQRPNDCSIDGFRCGSGAIAELCATTQKASCSETGYRIPCDSNEDCLSFDAGFCSFEPRPCFESRITRTGVASPVGTYCAFANEACTTNADCPGDGDFCAEDTSRPETVGLFCMPAATSPPVNAAYGITGPAVLRLSNVVQICRCGDGVAGCDEECDDGNLDDGDGCDEACKDE